MNPIYLWIALYLVIGLLWQVKAAGNIKRINPYIAGKPGIMLIGRISEALFWPLSMPATIYVMRVMGLTERTDKPLKPIERIANSLESLQETIGTKLDELEDANNEVERLNKLYEDEKNSHYQTTEELAQAKQRIADLTAPRPVERLEVV